MINISDACKKLARVELNNGNIVKVFPNLVYNDTPIVEYNLADGLNGNAVDKNGDTHKINECHCYTLDGTRIDLNDVKGIGNNFYELLSGDELKYFTNVNELGDGETWRLFNDYSKVESLDLSNIKTLPAYTLFRCTSLESLNIPSGLTDIETYAIASCDGLQSLVVDDNNPKYTSRDSNGNECNCIVEKPVVTRGTRSAINNQLTLIQGCNVTILPDNIKHIASGAFDECTRLTSITLPDGLLTIGDNVFRGCTALSGTIVVPNTVESIGESSFMNCSTLQGVNINVPVISEQLFKDCSSLSNVTLGNNVTEIGKQAFMNCSSLTAITIPDGVTEIGTSVFANCDLRSVNTNNIETISTNAFANNIHLSSVTMTDSTVNIGNNAFNGASITEITIPQNIRTLSNTAFSNCNNLQRVVWDVNDTESTGYSGKFINNSETIRIFEFGEHCTVIPNGLCSRMYNIEAIIIPNTIIKIGNGAFAGTTISIGSGIRELVIPDSVTSIGGLMCFNCVSLETVTIGSGVTTIPTSCFAGCSSLETVDLSNNPDKIDLANTNAFQGCENLSLIIVPDDLIAEYRESQDWYEYRELIFGTSIYTITFDSMSGETTPSVQHVRCGGYIEDPGTVHKDLYEFEYWEDEDGNEWDFDEDYVIGDMTLYAHYREVKAIMVKSISNDVTNINMQYTGNYPANVEYSYDGLNWYNIWNNNNLTISLSEGYNDYVYFRGYNPNGFSRDWSNYTKFNIYNGQCDLFGNLMYLKDYNNAVNSIVYFEFLHCFQNCYAIRNCNKLELFNSATTLANYCYYYMFTYCTSLTTAPELPATTLADNCYQSLFAGCTSITTPPELPATSLADNCYSSMFYGCTSLTTAPALPTTTLVSGCYNSMFYNCTSLTTAPELPATALANYCYTNMFNGCTSLTTAPELPATTLAYGCYQYMFKGCNSLTTAPELPATILATSCYEGMFNGCNSLSSVTVAFADWNNGNSTYYWLSNVAQNGTFNCPLALNIERGDSRIPYNWNIVLTEHPTSDLYFESSGETYIGLNQLSGCQKIWYTKDNVNWNWNQLTVNSNVRLADGERLYLIGLLSGNNNSWGTNSQFRTSGDGTLSIHGNMNYLWDYRDLNAPLKEYCGYNLFGYCGGLIDASELTLGTSATTLANYCYQSMFNNCTSLTTSPELPATTLAEGCYDYMFSYCSSLTTAPELPVTTLANSCYVGMFRGCTSLTTAPELPATTLADWCYYSMFNNCTSLTTAPELPATTLGNNCYNSMFSNCTSLTTAPALPSTMLADGCYQFMFSYCTSLTTAPVLPATILADYCYQGVFANCTSLSSVTVAFTDWNSYQYSTSDWLTNVSQNGTFNCQFGLPIERGTSRIPENWVVNAGENTNMLRFKSHGNDVSTIGLNRISSYQTIEYASEGTNWAWSSLTSSVTVTMQPDEMVYVRGNLSNANDNWNNYTRFNITGNISIHGDMNYLWNMSGDDNITLRQYCGYRLFYNCTGLVDASELTLGTSATTLANYCYQYMFYGCTSLTTAQYTLPATTLASYCYNGMFEGCSSLETAPVLPATTLAEGCYYDMFNGCSSLNYVKCLAINGINQNDSTTNWVYRVQTNSGTFIKHPDATSWSTGSNGIPQNWTVQNTEVEEEDDMGFSLFD